jgi:hypothetical protein
MVVIGHSMGVNVFGYFMKWVESDLGGRSVIFQTNGKCGVLKDGV